MRELSSFPRVSLGVLPTPFYRLEGVSRLLGTNVWIKRDDMTGVALGGNKVRKLEFLLADAKEKGVNTVLTTGGAQSNHAMLTAACALRLGMEPILVLKKRGVWQRRGNQLLNHLLGADVRFVDSDTYDDVYAEMDRIAAEKEADGKRCCKIPVGGSVPLGSLGYVACMEELSRQAAEETIPIDHIVCATGSGGTHAGTALGAMLFLPETKVHGMSVDDDDFAHIVPELMRGTAKLLEYDRVISNSDVTLRPMYGPGYAIPSPEGNAAIRTLARTDGIILDPVYTGKAFAGLLAMAKEGAFRPEDNVVFLHTGGAGGLFAIDLE